MKNAKTLERSSKYNICIVGGGTAGWMSASMLSKVLSQEAHKITLIESDDFPTIGVGEASIPPIDTFNEIVGISKHDMLKRTQGTFKLGIDFVNWKEMGHSYFHPFGRNGSDFSNIFFHQHWARANLEKLARPLGAYSINSTAAQHNKFITKQNIPNSPLADITHAYHFDAGLYAEYLREIAEAQGTERINKTISHTGVDTKGNIDTIHFNDGSTHQADFYIDCSGFKGLLIKKALQTPYSDWSRYLPCNRAIAVVSKKLSPTPPYTKAIAHGFGWQWRIPLQYRTGNGIIYCSQFCDQEYAESLLLNNLNSEPISTPKHIKFTTGKVEKIWNKNCIAIGLSSGFLEPLESTSIHLIQSALSKFIGLFNSGSDHKTESCRFNKLMEDDMLYIRDFLVAHYKLTNRDDTEFWKYCKNIPLPQSLAEKIDLFKSSALLYRENQELFSENSWLALFLGQGLTPEGVTSIAKKIDLDTVESGLSRIHKTITKCVEQMPSHDQYLEKYCKA